MYVDAMVLRDRDTVSGGGLEERLYVQHDANFNVTALVNTSGTVVERYVYDPYGKRTVLDANWAADADGLSDVSMLHGHQGGTADAVLTNQVLFRHRILDVETMRWLQQDPHQPLYVDTMRFYQADRSTGGQGGNARASTDALNAEARTRTKAAKLFGSGHADDRWLWQYLDGANLYQYVGSNPLAHTDPEGLSTTRPSDPTPGQVLMPFTPWPADLAIKCEKTLFIAIGNAGGHIGATIAEGTSFVFNDLWFGRGGRSNAWGDVQRGCNECYRQVWKKTPPAPTPTTQPSAGG